MAPPAGLRLYMLSCQIPVIFRLSDFDRSVNIHIFDVFHKLREFFQRLRTKDKLQFKFIQVGLDIRHDGIVFLDLFIRHGLRRHILYGCIGSGPYIQRLFLDIIGITAQHIILFHQERLIIAAGINGERLLNGLCRTKSVNTGFPSTIS